MPACEKGIGNVILKPDSADLIDGVRVHPCSLWPDDRGYFLEVMRMGRGPASEFPSSSTQVSAAVSYPGTIKAFHIHKHQTDYWAPVAGMLQVALVDLRSAICALGNC
jgi:dTDP-4-dehydrorhamnose 3,5-epimerase